MIKKTILFIVIIIAILFYFRNTILTEAADYLILPDQLEPSDVIIVLGGETQGERTEKAVQLYKKGISDRLLFSDGTQLSWRTTAVEEMSALALELGVKPEQIYTEKKSRSTYENAVYSKQILVQKGWKTATVVTTSWHTRRSKYIFDKVFQDSGIQLYYAVAKDKRFDNLNEWWKDPEKQQTVLTEWAKLIVYRLKY